MEITQIYAIAAGGIFPIFILVHLLPWIVRFVRYVFLLISEHLIYPYLIRRHRILGPWSRAVVVIQLIYITGSIFCIGFRVSTIAEAGRRAGTLAVINMIPLFASPHLAFLADLLKIPLRIIRRVHRSTGIMAFLLCVFHALVVAKSKVSLPLNVPRNLFAVIGGSSLCFLLLLAFPLFRRLSYELFLRTHQALALASVYSVWRHLPSDGPFPRVYVYISAGLFMSMLLLETSVVIYQNGIFRYHLSRATITDCYGAVNLRIHLQKGIKIDSGRYINLWMPWMPFVSFWSFLQTHPFMVISWVPGEQDTIDLLIKPQRGLTQKLLSHAINGHSINPVVFFSGPHGANVAMNEYESILMIASGFGITAHLSSLKKLIYGYNARLVRTRRIHLVWQMRNKADGAAAQSFLNSVLQEDKLDDGCILSISIFLESHDIPMIPFGKRATVEPGTANLPKIFLEEVSGEHIKKPEIVLDQKTVRVMGRDPEKTAVGLKDLESGSLKTASAIGRWDSEKTAVELKDLESGKSKIISAMGRWNSEKTAVELKDLESGSSKTTTRKGKMLVTVSSNNEIRDQMRALVRDYIQDGVSLVELDYQPNN